jgi:hypothetical protein
VFETGDVFVVTELVMTVGNLEIFLRAKILVASKE